MTPPSSGQPAATIKVTTSSGCYVLSRPLPAYKKLWAEVVFQSNLVSEVLAVSRRARLAPWPAGAGAGVGGKGGGQVEGRCQLASGCRLRACAAAWGCLCPPKKTLSLCPPLALPCARARQIVDASSGGNPATTFDDVVARVARNKAAYKGYSSAREALLLNGRFVLAQLAAVDEARRGVSSSAKDKGKAAAGASEWAFCKGLEAEVRAAGAGRGPRGGVGWRVGQAARVRGAGRATPHSSVQDLRRRRQMGCARCSCRARARALLS